MIYECTVSGGEGDTAVTTVWKGGAFHCKDSPNVITLLYNSPQNVSQSCNNGDIIGRSVKLENTSYGINHTSQLLVTLTSDIVNSWIECVDDNGFNEALVGSLNITAGKLLSVNLPILAIIYMVHCQVYHVKNMTLAMI